jgi:hypothetical protein
MSISIPITPVPTFSLLPPRSRLLPLSSSLFFQPQKFHDLQHHQGSMILATSSQPYHDSAHESTYTTSMRMLSCETCCQNRKSHRASRASPIPSHGIWPIEVTVTSVYPTHAPSESGLCTDDCCYLIPFLVLDTFLPSPSYRIHPPTRTTGRPWTPLATCKGGVHQAPSV